MVQRHVGRRGCGGTLPAPAIFPCGENAVELRSTGFPEGSAGAGRAGAPAWAKLPGAVPQPREEV